MTLDSLSQHVHFQRVNEVKLSIYGKSLVFPFRATNIPQSWILLSVWGQDKIYQKNSYFSH